MKGMLEAVFANGGVGRSAVVEFWFQSPTGDSSDSQIFRMACVDMAQANEIATFYQKAHGIGGYFGSDVHAKAKAAVAATGSVPVRTVASIRS